MSRLMATRKFDHPFRIRRLGPELPSQNAALEFIAEYQAMGKIRRCVHATTVRTETGPYGHVYQVTCEKDSFDVRQVPPRESGDHTRGFFGCPKGCRLYRPRWRQSLASWRRRVRPLSWFGQQPWQVKVALICAVVFLAALYSHALKELADLIRAATEAWRSK